jgi:hypothetical protein
MFVLGVKRGHENPDAVERHAKEIKGIIECFDQVVLFGTYKAIRVPNPNNRAL